MRALSYSISGVNATQLVEHARAQDSFHVTIATHLQ
jgi:hypothetical protein